MPSSTTQTEEKADGQKNRKSKAELELRRACRFETYRPVANKTRKGSAAGENSSSLSFGRKHNEHPTIQIQLTGIPKHHHLQYECSDSKPEAAEHTGSGDWYRKQKK